MRRRVLLALAWLPAVLCAAAWPASHVWQFNATYAPVGGVELSHGGAYFVGPAVVEGWAGLSATPALPYPGAEQWVGVPANQWLPFCALEAGLGPFGVLPSVIIYVVRLWLPTLAFAFPAAAWVTRRHERRRSPGLCPSCGYDPRATPARCPECGRNFTGVSA